jgi:branched-chain amino acid transport system ATP-binding protein
MIDTAVCRPSCACQRLALELITGRTRNHAAVDATLDLLGLRSLADELPGVLTQGQRKLVGVARALVSKPRVICLDEPAAGLDTHESRELGRTLREIARAGTSMLLIDHDMGLVLTHCDEVTVLEFERTIAQGRPSEVGADRGVVETYLGKAASAVMTEIAEP